MQQITGSIVLSKLQINNDKYYVVSSAEDIARFKTKNEEGKEVYETSPQILTIELYKEENGQKIPVDFKENYKFYLYGSDSDSNSVFSEYISFESDSTNKDGVLVFQIQKFVQDKKLTNEASIFIFEYVLENSVVVSKSFQIRDGVSQDLAQFNMTAAAINQSVGSTQMSFTKDGLEIREGGFKIIQNDEQVLGFETKTIGEQEVSSFVVRGTIYADDGEFKGKIHATDADFDSGKIGGFEIEDGKLVSLNKISENNEQTPTIELNGNDGKIIAHSIELGDNATVRNQIRLGTTGSAYLYNPDKNGGKFIESGNILVKNNGTAKFGEISVDGSDSKISGNTWSIGKDYASFSNINISGSIETAVFKTNSIQAAGGAMIFRPSYKVSLIKESGNYLVQFEDKYEGALGNTIQIVFNGTNQGYTGTVNSITDNIMRVDWDEGHEPQQTLASATLIDYGSKNYTNPAYNYPAQGEVYYSDNKGTKIEDLSKIYSSFSHSNEGYLTCADLQYTEEKEFLKSNNKLVADFNMLINSIRNLYIKEVDILIGINTGRTKVGMNGSVLPRGLTLAELGEVNPRLYLGDLSQLGSDYSGYGLYADNVFLNGSLTTKLTEITEENTKVSYAGVNTLNEASATKFEEKDTSRIVFWAGAEGITIPDIQDAPFQVTEDGSLYASRAKLKDTLVVGGTIEAAEIHTAKLRGKGGALSIYDGAKGIQFIKEGNQDPEQVIFSINTSGLAAGDKNFVSIVNDDDNENKITILGDYVRTSNNNNYLSLETIKKEGGKVTPVLKHIEGDNNCGFYFEPTKTIFKMNENPIQTWNLEGTQIHNTFELKQEKCSMQYKQENNGYNLYIVMS